MGEIENKSRKGVDIKGDDETGKILVENTISHLHLQRLFLQELKFQIPSKTFPEHFKPLSPTLHCSKMYDNKMQEQSFLTEGVRK